MNTEITSYKFQVRVVEWMRKKQRNIPPAMTKSYTSLYDASSSGALSRGALESARFANCELCKSNDGHAEVTCSSEDSVSKTHVDALPTVK